VAVTATKANYQVELAALPTVAAGTIGVLQFNIGETVSTVHIDNVTLVAKPGGSPVAQRAPARPFAPLRLATTAEGLSWSVRAPLAHPAELVIVAPSGREVGRFRLAAGLSRGTLAARLPQGLLLGSVEGMGQTLFLSE
jgi:hypothetical protein